MSDRNGGFIPIEDQQAGLKLVRDACRLNAPTRIWLKDQGVVSATHLAGFNFNQGRFQVAITDELDLAALKEGVSKDPFVYLSFDTQGLSLFVKARFAGMSLPAARIELHLPETIYRMQQRKHPRAIVRHRTDIQFLHPDPMSPNRTLSRKVNDLSMGGASVILFYGEERHYHVRQRIEGIELTLGDLAIKTWGIVRHLAVFPPDSDIQGIKLGIEFFNLGPREQKAISELVDLELRQQFQTVEGNP